MYRNMRNNMSRKNILMSRRSSYHSYDELEDEQLEDEQKIFWRKISMVDGIIFDMDGVLVDSERQSNEGWKWAAKKQGIDMPMWLIDSFKGAPDELNRKMFDDYFDGKADYWETKKLRTEHIYKIREKEGLPVKKGVKEIFEYIKANISLTPF